MARSVILLCVILSAMPPASGGDWPRFRGRNGMGMGQGDSIPAQWTPADYNWKVKLPGTGHGSPVIWADRIFLMCGNDDATRIVVCLRAADGSLRWTREFKDTRWVLVAMNRSSTQPTCPGDG
jgi:outer membrane protein assembly factor BamB